MEDIVGLIMGIGLAVIIALIVMQMQKRKRGRSWSGVVIGIRRFNETDHSRAARDHVVIKYRTDQGKKGKLHLDDVSYGRLYAKLKIGDRLFKQAGEDYPRFESEATKN